MRRGALAATTVALLLGCAASANAAGSGEVSAVEAQGPDLFDSSAPRFPGTRPPGAGSEELRTIRRTAEAGNRGAQSHLGVMYRMGRGVPQSDARSFRWFREAALAGDPASSFRSSSPENPPRWPG